MLSLIARGTHNYNVCSTLLGRSQWSTRRKPITICVLFDPIAHGLLFLGADSFVQSANTLENIVHGFGNAENARPWLWDIPDRSDQLEIQVACAYIPR
jgi:hypothetical protein